MTEESKEKFTISIHDNGYYCVSIPNYSGGNVVRAEDYDQQVSQNETQAENIRHLQEQFRVMREAIESAISVLKMDFPGSIKRKAAIKQLQDSITPKGETK